MRLRAPALAPALALALLLPGAAPAHERPFPHAHVAQAGRPDAAIEELNRQRARPEVPPGVQAQRREAQDADAAAADDAAAQLRAAHAAIRARRAGQANELLERAESRLLTRSTLATRAGEAVQGGPVARIAAARAALLKGDRDAALAAVDEALAALDRPRRRGR
ncbi:hypothetical protein ACI6QG_16030 [Roseococcus sp. DSY-14]|uniref:hypothetical protein n=1 Tax=Roseococcus sp. DSY-14 TaxID=3369650 RepID=UPI00387AD2CA